MLYKYTKTIHAYVPTTEQFNSVWDQKERVLDGLAKEPNHEWIIQ